MIHFELICVYGLGKGSNFILLHVDIQLYQPHLLKRLFFPPVNCLGSQSDLCEINPPLYPCALLFSLKASSVTKIRYKIFFFFFFFFLLAYIWFTVLCWFQVYSKVNQLYMYIYPLFFRFFSIIDYYKILNIVPCAIQ